MRLERDSLLLFVRFPEPGRVKTRLVPRLGAEGAARLYRRMAEVVAGEAERWSEDGILAVIETCRQAREALAVNVAPRLTMEIVVGQLARGAA